MIRHCWWFSETSGFCCRRNGPMLPFPSWCARGTDGHGEYLQEDRETLERECPEYKHYAPEEQP